MMRLAVKSLNSRRFTVMLTVLAVAFSVTLLLGVERLREAARTGFSDTITGLDLIVAARGNDLQILLATVFGIGSTANPVRWETYRDIAARPEVEWAVPIALGDTHAGFPVVGTTSEYFDRYRFGRNRSLDFADGVSLQGATDAVIGAEIADALGYSVGTSIVNAHGVGEIETQLHDEAPFVVKGVLERTGTPVDRMVFVSLGGFAAIHAPLAERPADPLAVQDQQAEEESGQPYVMTSGHEDDGHEHEEDTATGDHSTGAAEGNINAIFVGLIAPEAALSTQRAIAQYDEEPLTGVLPTATLFRLWSITSAAESALRAIAVAVVATGLVGLVVMVTATLEARRREFAILRSVGASPAHVAGLVLIEAASVAFAGIVLGLVLLGLAAVVAGPFLSNAFGLTMNFASLSARECAILLGIAFAALLASLIPALRVFRQTLADGLNIRL